MTFSVRESEQYLFWHLNSYNNFKGKGYRYVNTLTKLAWLHTEVCGIHV